ncbi:MAG: hypothetical protein JSW58_01265 [Candidatus Latescibacterota bacterium]|nr:MAG: hypothetical protein JSW58_01265 [Candidatus Latescibacterota bacterium]
MRLLVTSFLCVALVLSISTISALASKDELTRFPLRNVTPKPIIIGPKVPGQVCQVGNLNAPAWSIGDFLLPPEEYKLVFDPNLGCGDCQIGFAVNTVHVLVQTAEACEIVMAVDVEEADVTDPSCPQPGPLMCASGLYTVTITGAGLWDIGLPITCGCLTMDRIYLLSFYVESFSCAPLGTTPDLITDAGPPTLCTNWNNYGTGWIDLVAQYPTWPGQLVVYADAECCSPPVPVEDSTWGAIKALYDN